MDSERDRRPICLVRAPTVETFRFATTSITPPLGLAYIAGALEATGEQVQIVDAVAEAPDTFVRYFKGYLLGLPFDEIAARIAADTKLIGISVIFTHEWPAAIQLVNAIKKRHPDVPIVLGGEHITSMPEFCLRTSAADYLVLGEGEETVVQLVHALDHGGELDKIDGLVFRAGDEILVNPRRNRTLEIDDIARPAWHLIDLDTYHANRWMGGMYTSTKSVPILATRGCPYQCTYCSSPNMWTPRWIPRDPAQVADEIQYYVEHLGARNFPFQDLTAIIRREWIVDFCNELLERDLDITWQLPSGTRSEAIDEEVADLLRRTGMINMAYAPESGSEETRQLVKKKMHTERLFESIRAAVKSDLNVSVFIVVGFPHDKPAHLRQNLPFLDRLAEAGITDIAVAFYMALPGTQIFDSLYDSGKIHIDLAYFRHILASTSLWSTSTYCEEMSNTELTLWKLRLFRRFYSRRRARVHSTGVRSTLQQAVASLRGKGGDVSKFQTAFRNGMTSGVETAKSKLRPGWMSRAEEQKLFEGWDDIFREIRERNVQEGVHVPAPADTRLLHETNVIKPLKATHGARRRLPVRSA
jgi:anaerobic magnesium-protoporphyrin IX monomethyl ester cyclase